MENHDLSGKHIDGKTGETSAKTVVTSFVEGVEAFRVVSLESFLLAVVTVLVIG